MHEGDIDFTISRLGDCRIISQMPGVRFTRDDECLLYHARLEDLKAWINKQADLPSNGSHRTEGETVLRPLEAGGPAWK